MKTYDYTDLPSRVQDKINNGLRNLYGGRFAETSFVSASITSWISLLKEYNLYDEEVESALFVLTMSSES